MSIAESSGTLVPIRRLRLILPAVLVLAFVSTPASATFFDVPPEHPYVKAIDVLTREGILRGYENRSFQPERVVSRAEIVTILSRALYGDEGLDACVDSELPSFPDVPRSSWFWPGVCSMWLNGIVSGHPDGTFKPEDGVRFVEAAKMLSLFFGHTAVALPELGDANVLWYTPYVDSLTALGAVPPSIRGMEHRATRGEIAEMMYRLSVRPSPDHTALENPSLTSEEIAYPVDWETYGNTIEGFAIDYSQVWPAPHRLPRGTDDFVPFVRSDWTVYAGPLPNRCEGVSTTCVERDIQIDGFGYAFGDQIVYDLESNPAIIDILNEAEIHGLPVIVFLEETDLCVHKRAFIFGADTIYGFTYRCAGANADRSHMFDQVLASFREIPKETPYR